MGNIRHNVVVVLHPSVCKYFNSFLNSLVDQTFSQFRVLIFVDAVDAVDVRFKKHLRHLDYTLIHLTNSDVAKNRFWIFNYLKSNIEGYCHFCDADDFLEPNYLSATLPFFSKYNIVCHDFNLANENGDIVVEHFWTERLIDKFVFNHTFIEKKNIVGLGNTSLKSEIIKNFELPENVTISIPDWYIFYLLLFHLKENAIFIKEGVFNYRQHYNLASINILDPESLRAKLEQVQLHYKALVESGFVQFANLLNKLNDLKENLNIDLLEGYIKAAPKKNYFWWEEIEDLLNFYENTFIKKKRDC